MPTLFKKVSLVLALVFAFSFAAPAQEAAETGAVKISWEEFKKLLDLGKDEIVLSWAEFQQIIAQTDTKIVPAFELREEKVVLTRAQFRNLLEKMKPQTSTGVQRPAESLLRRSAYRGRLAGGAVLVLADISADVFPATPGAFVSLSLFPGQIAVRDIRLNDIPALIEIKDGRYTVSTARAGQLRIAVDFALRATGEQVQGVSFPVPRTPITTLEFDLPHRGLEVEVLGAQQLEVSERGSGTHIFAVLTPTETVSLKWRKKIAEALPGPAKTYADTLTLISIEEDAVRISAEIALTVLQNTIPALVLRAPEGYNILDVRGPGVGEWRELARKEGTYLEVPFDFPKKGNFAVTVAAEKILPGGDQAAGYEGFTVVDAIREKGFLGVELKGAAEVVVSSLESADALDVSELPGSLIGRSLKPLIFGFKYLRSPYALVFDIKKHEEVRVVSTVIDLASGVTLVTGDGKIVHRVVYSVRNTSKQFLELALPKDAELWSVFVDGAPAKPRRGDGKIMVPLNRSREGASGLAAFDVEVIYHQKTPRFGSFGRRSADFPVPDIIVSQALWSVYLPAGYDYLRFGGSVEKEKSASGLRPLLRLKRRTASLIEPAAPQPGEEVPPDYKDRVLRQADEMKKEFGAKLVLDQSQLASQVENELRFNRRLQDVQSGGAPVAAGVLPIRVQIPTSGELFRFAETLLSGEPMTLRLTYVGGGLKRLVLGLLLAAVSLAVYLLLKKSLRNRKPAAAA
jgi:hypothetical protein